MIIRQALVALPYMKIELLKSERSASLNPSSLEELVGTCNHNWESYLE